ncbi:MAG: multicopper oxidase domain-containing protein [Tepidisphaeraceae bacterium]
MITRRNMLLSTAALAASGSLITRAEDRPALRHSATVPADSAPLAPGEPGVHYNPVVTPNGATLPYRLVDGVKVFHLIAEEVEDHEFAPGLRCKVWGYNGRSPGPTIEVVEGDRVRIFVTNKLPEPTSVHWHGVLVPAGMDGVAAITQPVIPPGETFKYEFTLRQHGTQMYHPHTDEMIQIAMGMTGMFIIHPRHPDPLISPRVDRDFALMLHEWRIDAGASRPNPLEMTDFNVLTFNSKAFPGTAPLVVKTGDRVRLRFGNLGPMDHHPIHLHGFQFHHVGTDGGPVPPSARVPMTTVLVPVGTTQTVEFIADEPGDWVMHCHMTHHMMNQMGHGFTNTLGMRTEDLEPRLRALVPGYMTMGQRGMAEMGEMHMPMPANSIPMKGADMQFGYTDMGGMFTLLKVRDELKNYDEDPGFYPHLAGTVPGPATAPELALLGAPMPATTKPTTKPAALYTCPMHEEVVQRGPGKCPKCKMALEPKK